MCISTNITTSQDAPRMGAGLAGTFNQTNQGRGVNAMEDPRRLDEVWKQGAIPVILRRDGWHEKLRVRLPKGDDNGKWINSLGKSYAAWIHGGSYWELPKSWFNSFVNQALARYKRLYVIQPYREQEKCAPACMNATGHECECSCMGANHGAGNDGSWFEVSDTFATRWNEKELACRLMTVRSLPAGSTTQFEDLLG